jgi:hypothetical protein
VNGKIQIAIEVRTAKSTKKLARKSEDQYARSKVRRRPEEDPEEASRLEARHARRPAGQKRGMPEGK